VRLRKNLDWSLVILTFAVAVMGLFAVYSATYGHSGRFLQKQLVALGIGTCGMLAAASVDYSRIGKYAKALYIFNLLFLLSVFKLAAKTKGSTRWINLGLFQAQPSEFAK